MVARLRVCLLLGASCGGLRVAAVAVPVVQEAADAVSLVQRVARAPHASEADQDPAPATEACRRISDAYWQRDGPRWVLKSGPKTYDCGGCNDSTCRRYYKYGEGANGFVGNETMIERCRAAAPRELFDCDEIRPGASLKAVFFGSSHMRIDFFHVWRLLAQRYWPEPLPSAMTGEAAGGAKLPEQLVGRGNHDAEDVDRDVDDDWRDADRGRYLNEMEAGVRGWQHGDVPICGGKAVIRTFFQFKHQYTLEGENDLLLENLAKVGMSDPDYFITEQSIWSMFPSMLKEQGNWDETQYVESELAYMQWVKDHFARGNTQTLWYFGSSESPGHADLAVARSDLFIERFGNVQARSPAWKVCLVDREAAARPPDSMVCGHGCDGPFVMLRSQMLLQEWNLFLKGMPTGAV